MGQPGVGADHGHAAVTRGFQTLTHAWIAKSLAMPWKMQHRDVTELCNKHAKKCSESSDPPASTAPELVPIHNYSLQDILSPCENAQKGVRKKSREKSHIIVTYYFFNIDACEMGISSATGLGLQVSAGAVVWR